MSSSSGSALCGQRRVEQDAAAQCSGAGSAGPARWEETHTQCVRAGLAIMYGERLASETATLCCSDASDSQLLYIVGCLLLNLTASVNPGYSSVEKRRLSLTQVLQGSEAAAAAEAGLFLGPAGSAGGGGQQQQQQQQLRCFHCNAHMDGAPSGSASPDRWWHRHRSASPACYFVRLRDFVAAPATQPVSGDVERFRRALRKLQRDLSGAESLRLAREFGYSHAALAFAATRHFMRNGGAVPDRAGDMIAHLHACQEQFEPRAMESLDVKLALSGLAALSDCRGQVAASASAQQLPVQLAREQTSSLGYSNGWNHAS